MIALCSFLNINLFAEKIAERSCVSYETTKEMFKFNDVSVVGKTCKVKIEKTSSGKNSLNFKVSFSSKDLDSGSGIRDSEVAELLGETVVYNLEVPMDIWKNRSGVKNFTLKGKLKLKTGEFPVAFSVSKKGEKDQTFVGVYKGKFTDFGMEPPRVGPGGFISDVGESLTLRFEIDLE